MSQQMDNAQRAQVLVHALPYIQKYANKIIVVKYGGNAMLNEELKSAVMNDIVLLSLIGIRVVLVHGGGPEITETLKAMGKTSTFVEGRRVTDEETAGVVQMVLAGKINKSLVNRIGAIGGKAIGLCGLDGRMIRQRPWIWTGGAMWATSPKWTPSRCWTCWLWAISRWWPRWLRRCRERIQHQRGYRSLPPSRGAQGGVPDQPDGYRRHHAG